LASKKFIAIHYAWHLMWAGGQCEVADCKCPYGRNHFDDVGPWIPSPDRHPIPARLGGTYDLENVRLSHQTCNKMDGGKAGGSAKTAAKILACRENWAKADLQKAGLNPHSRNLTQEDRDRGGIKGRCKRWYINRGLDCICGEHID
jgi:hypothetical protein